MNWIDLDWLVVVPTLVGAFVLGAVIGSFACCQAWRLRLKEQGKPVKNQRSICLNCKEQLKWYENIPIVSWIMQRGRCRKCRAKIGGAEILSEIGLGLTFVALTLDACVGGLLANESSATIWALLSLVLLLTLATLHLVLLIYDAKWGRLPNRLLLEAVGVALIYALCQIFQDTTTLWPTVGAVGLLAGVYYLLYFGSHEKLVGSGDWLLALSIALVLGHWWLAIVELFLANALALFWNLPKIFKKGRKKQVYFGPFLIIAGLVIFLLRTWLLGLVAGLL